MNNKIIVLTGFSASGKDSIADYLAEEGYHLIKSVTSRPIRGNEEHGKQYHFTSEPMFLDLIKNNKLIEYREYNTLVKNEPAVWYYGVPKWAVPDDKPSVVVLDIVGLKAFREYFGGRVVSIFLVVGDCTRKERCILRGDYDETEFNRRLKDDIEKFPEEVLTEYIDYYLQNDRSFIETLLDLDCILESIDGQ